MPLTNSWNGPSTDLDPSTFKLKSPKAKSMPLCPLNSIQSPPAAPFLKLFHSADQYTLNSRSTCFTFCTPFMLINHIPCSRSTFHSPIRWFMLLEYGRHDITLSILMRISNMSPKHLQNIS